MISFNPYFSSFLTLITEELYLGKHFPVAAFGKLIPEKVLGLKISQNLVNTFPLTSAGYKIRSIYRFQKEIRY